MLLINDNTGVTAFKSLGESRSWPSIGDDNVESILIPVEQFFNSAAGGSTLSKKTKELKLSCDLLKMMKNEGRHCCLCAAYGFDILANACHLIGWQLRGYRSQKVNSLSVNWLPACWLIESEECMKESKMNEDSGSSLIVVCPSSPPSLAWVLCVWVLRHPPARGWMKHETPRPPRKVTNTKGQRHRKRHTTSRGILLQAKNESQMNQMLWFKSDVGSMMTGWEASCYDDRCIKSVENNLRSLLTCSVFSEHRIHFWFKLIVLERRVDAAFRLFLWNFRLWIKESSL